MRSRVRHSLIPVLAACAMVACQAGDSKVSEPLRQAGASLEAGDFDTAIAAYQRVLEVDPDHGQAHYGLAKAFFGNTQTREGIAALRAAARLDETSSDANLQLAQMLILAGDPGTALVHADRAVEIEPGRAATHLARGQALTALSRSDEALEAFERAVETQPDDLRAVLSLAVAHNNEGRLDAAEETFRRAVELEPGFQSTTSLGNFLAQNPSRDTETEAAFREASGQAASDSEKIHANKLLAGFYLQRQRYAEGRSVLKDAIATLGDAQELFYILAHLEVADGHPETATAVLEEVARIHPAEARPQLALSAHRGRQGDPDGALAAARKAVEIEPDSDGAMLRVAELLIDRGYRKRLHKDVREGHKMAAAVLERVPSHPRARMLVSKVDLAEGRVDEAVANLRSAVKSAPGFVQARYRLGAALLLQGHREEARAELTRTLELDPTQLDARRLLARAEAMLGEPEKAVAQAREVLRVSPGSHTMRILIARNLVLLNRGDEALAVLEAVPESKRSVAVLHEMGRIAAQRGEVDTARALFGAVLEQEPTHHDALRGMVPLDLQAGLFDLSRKRIEAAVKGNPEDSDLRLLAGVVAVIDGRPADAKRAFEKAIELDPRNTIAYEHLARFYAMGGDLEEAVNNYEVAVAAQPEDPSLHYFLGVLYQYGGNLNRAAQSYEKAIEHAADFAEAKNNLAYLLAEAGKQLDRALQLAREAHGQMPGSPHVADTLGWVLVKRGDAGEGIPVLQQAESSATGMRDANSLGTIRRHLAEAYLVAGSPVEAGDTAKRALSELEEEAKRRRAEGKQPAQEPQWAAAMREMLKQLESES